MKIKNKLLRKIFYKKYNIEISTEKIADVDRFGVWI